MRRLASFIIVVLCMPVFFMGLLQYQKSIGQKPVAVPVVGTGSMYPSLFWDKSEGGPDDAEAQVIDERRTTPFMYRKTAQTVVGRGDMVAFQNDKTASILKIEGKDTGAGFIKRVIGLPGDTIELRDGFVYRNKEEIEEPYIARARSTYGDQSLGDCKQLVVPKGQYLVMGDNRKVSSDSRGELGLISLNDISFVLPYDKQDYYRSLWRDTSSDSELAGTPTLDAKEFYTLINQVRKDHGVPALIPQKTLELSASYTAKGSGMAEAMNKAGYHNILTSQFEISGHYSAQELLKNLLYFKKTADQILDPQMDDIGISDVNLDINGCPGETIVGQLGGYLPADYDQETVGSWKELESNLNSVIPSWEQASNYPNIDQAKLSELLSIYRKRLALSKEIVATMEKREWLTEDQQNRIKADNIDADRAGNLAKELNQ